MGYTHIVHFSAATLYLPACLLCATHTKKKSKWKNTNLNWPHNVFCLHFILIKYDDGHENGPEEREAHSIPHFTISLHCCAMVYVCCVCERGLIFSFHLGWQTVVYLALLWERRVETICTERVTYKQPRTHTPFHLLVLLFAVDLAIHISCRHQIRITI